MNYYYYCKHACNNDYNHYDYRFSTDLRQKFKISQQTD